ncbi:MAG: adenosylcobinamide-GDP ribazoletransferase [Deltaproteobacteria bacterium]|nr:adenosylcobinamide-GDP ribazoletransferase [Deltaproteobacteria bacterium]
MKTFFKALIFAIQFLTRIPIPVAVEPDGRIARYGLILFPCVGWLIGGMLYSLCALMLLAGTLSPLTIAVLLVTAETLLTGAFHLDGLADTFDAFFSTAKTPEKKLEIMKDSRIGVMGAVALMLALLVKITLAADIVTRGHSFIILLFPVIGRWSQVALCTFSPYVRTAGIVHLFSLAGDKKTLLFASLFLAPFFILPGSAASLAGVAAFLFLYRRYVHRHIGGITGDVLGSASVLTEIIFLACACLLF